MEKYKTKVDIVYETLLNEILNGAYKPGERLIISQISKRFNISDIPVREAIRNLESEGYVTIIANQGAVVNRFDEETLISIVQIKAVLEGYATLMSLKYITPEIIAELRALNEEMKQTYNDGEYNGYSKLNTRFHLEIYNCIPSRELYKMISDLWKKWSITKSVFDLVPESIQESIGEHDILIQMLEERNEKDIEMYVRNHKLRAGYRLIESLHGNCEAEEIGKNWEEKK